MSRPHVQQSVEESVWAEQAGLVELLLLQVEVLVHWLHEGAEHVDGRVADPVVTQLERFRNLDADLKSSKTWFI